MADVPDTPQLEHIRTVSHNWRICHLLLKSLQERYPDAMVIDLHIRKVLDEHFEVDNEAAERERGLLLEYQRQLNEENGYGG